MMHIEKPSGDVTQWAEKLADFFGPGHVDQTVRQALQACWSAIPKARRTPEELECQFRRLVERALKDFREDCDAFGGGGAVGAGLLEPHSEKGNDSPASSN